jgi:hypothetical protein
MNRKVKRYDPISSDGTCGMCIEDADYGAYVEYEDYVALETECDSLWSTYVALVDKLGIDTEKAKTAYGKPSDVIVSYVDALRAENDRLRAERDAFRDSRNYLIEEISSHLSEIAELREALCDTARWIERLPVQAQGAIRQLERIDAALTRRANAEGDQQ